MTALSELFLPARTLDYGTYQLTLTVSMTAVHPSRHPQRRPT